MVPVCTGSTDAVCLCKDHGLFTRRFAALTCNAPLFIQLIALRRNPRIAIEILLKATRQSVVQKQSAYMMLPNELVQRRTSEPVEKGNG